MSTGDKLIIAGVVTILAAFAVVALTITDSDYGFALVYCIGGSRSGTNFHSHFDAGNSLDSYILASRIHKIEKSAERWRNRGHLA